jgi:hypothetical protein
MSAKYEVRDTRIIQVESWGEERTYAVCDYPHKALNMLNKAWDLNAKRKYTASARLIAEVESLPGFRWNQA